MNSRISLNGSDWLFKSSTAKTGAGVIRICLEISRLVSETLAEVTACALADTGQNRLVVAGGETSAAVCARLGINGMRVWKEIQPGLPSCVSLNDPPRMLVLKSGSFGKRTSLSEHWSI